MSLNPPASASLPTSPDACDDDRGTTYLIVEAVLVSIALTVVIFRFVSRMLSRKCLGIDDYAMFFGMVGPRCLKQYPYAYRVVCRPSHLWHCCTCVVIRARQAYFLPRAVRSGQSYAPLLHLDAFGLFRCVLGQALYHHICSQDWRSLETVSIGVDYEHRSSGLRKGGICSCTLVAVSTDGRVLGSHNSWISRMSFTYFHSGCIVCVSRCVSCVKLTESIY